MKYHSEKFDRVLNEIASGFLYLRPRPLDQRPSAISRWQRDPPRAISYNSSFGTDYFFSHRDKMPQCSGLKTFREPRD